MNTGRIIFLIAAASMYVGLLSGCIIAVPYSCGVQNIFGTGNVVSLDREVPEFNRIHLKGTGRVILDRGDVTTVAIKTDDNILPLIKTVVKDNVLEISHKSVNLKPTILEFHINVRQLKGISISGSGDVFGQSLFTVEAFEAVIKGSGDMNLAVDASRLIAEIKGSGSMDLTGEAEDFRASIKGSGDIRASNLETNHATVSIAGSGDCHVYASESLRAEISGSGDVIYGGRPMVESHIRGSGSVRSDK